MENDSNAGRVSPLTKERIESIASAYAYKTGSVYKENVIPFAEAVATATVAALERAGWRKP